MNHMTDDNGSTWRVGDRVVRTDDHMQGIITDIISSRIVLVKFPGCEHLTFVSGLWNVSEGETVK